MTTGITAIDALAGRVAAGEEITESDAQVLLDTPDLIAVASVADEVRAGLRGTRATFVRVFEVHVDALPSSVPASTAAGEVRVVGAPLSVDHAVAAVRAAVGLSLAAPVTGFSLADLQALEGGRLRDVCARLREAGLDGVAEVPIDMLADPVSAVQDAREAGLHVLVLTTHALLPAQRLAVCTRARDLQHAVGGLLAFAPLPRATSAGAPSTGYDDVKQIAAARVVVRNIPSIQVDWVQYGPKLAQVSLTMGADDVDRVAAVDPGVLGTRRSPVEEIRRNIRAAGFEPLERDGRFAAVPQ